MQTFITTEIQSILSLFSSKKVLLDISPINSFASNNTYAEFQWYQDDDTLMFLDGSEDSQQNLHISKDNLKEIKLSKGQNYYNSVIDINLLDNSKITLYLSDLPIKCCKCNQIIETPVETEWKISGYGNYGSHFDGEKLDLSLCDDCLYTILGYKEVAKDE